MGTLHSFGPDIADLLYLLPQASVSASEGAGEEVGKEDVKKSGEKSESEESDVGGLGLFDDEGGGVEWEATNAMPAPKKVEVDLVGPWGQYFGGPAPQKGPKKQGTILNLQYLSVASDLTAKNSSLRWDHHFFIREVLA